MMRSWCMRLKNLLKRPIRNTSGTEIRWDKGDSRVTIVTGDPDMYKKMVDLSLLFPVVQVPYEDPDVIVVTIPKGLFEVNVGAKDNRVQVRS